MTGAPLSVRGLPAAERERRLADLARPAPRGPLAPAIDVAQVLGDKHARDMTAGERAAALVKLKRSGF
jgi:hypothetical protein